MGSRTSLDGCIKFCLYQDYDPWTIQARASCYTDYAVVTQPINHKESVFKVCVDLLRSGSN